MDSFGCDDGYAWAWLTDSSSGTTSPISELFVDTGDGSWSLLPPNEYCDQPGTGLPKDVLTNGCKYFGDGYGSGDMD